MSRRSWLGLVLLAAAGCGGSEDWAPGGGGAGGPGGIDDESPACVQAPKCTPALTLPIERICVEDACVDVGVREGGEVVTSDMYVFTKLPRQGVAQTVRSFAMSVLHPTRPNGERLGCDDLLELAPEKRRNAGYTNVLEWQVGRVDNGAGSDVFPAPVTGIPANEPGVEYLVLSELWSGGLDTFTGANTGVIVGVGCADGFVAVPGPYLDGDGAVDEAHTFTLQSAWTE